MYKLKKEIRLMSENLLILGAGQYGMLVREVAMSTGKFDNIAFLDDESSIAVGRIDDYKDFVSKCRYAFVAIGNSAVRSKLLSMLESAGFELAVIVSPFAYVSASAQIGGGSIVEPMAVVNTGVTLGKGSLVCAGAVVNHNAVVEDCCQIDCNAVVSARGNVPAGTKVESGCVYK